MGFKRDLNLGHDAEDFVISKFQEAGWVCERSKRGEVGWDFNASLESPGPHGTSKCWEVTVEVKHDKMGDRTGNLAIEYWNPKKNKVSGLSASTSDFWIFCLNQPLEAYIVSRKNLLEYVDSHEPFRIVDAGGDDNASLLLYKREVILASIFYQIQESIALNNYIFENLP